MSRTVIFRCLLFAASLCVLAACGEGISDPGCYTDPDTNQYVCAGE